MKDIDDDGDDDGDDDDDDDDDGINTSNLFTNKNNQ